MFNTFQVKMGILMGTANFTIDIVVIVRLLLLFVRTIIRNSIKETLDQYDILISPAAPSVAYKICEKKNDPLAMYAGDIMT
ncbi:glutamyl-tRNA(Gln) amidotransferase subunit A chloroplastic/mitochondrial-like, partial [Trifolium pratense]